MNLIPISNYTQIPNIIFDHWMSILSPSAFKVLICMCRKIFGWHKTSDTISKNQIMQVTGMSKNSVQSAIEELEGHALIIKFQFKNEYGHQPNEYSLNIEKPEDTLYQDDKKRGGVTQNLGGGGSKSDLGVGQNLTQGVGQNLTPQKKDYTKERLTKEQPPNPQKGEERESKKVKIIEKKKYKDFVLLSEEEYAKLLEQYGGVKLAAMIDMLDAYIGSNGKKYQSHYHTLLPSGWVNKRYEEEKPKTVVKQTYVAKSNTIDTEEISKRRLFWGDERKKNWTSFKEKPKDIGVEYIQFGADILYYNNPKFYELLSHYVKKHTGQ